MARFLLPLAVVLLAALLLWPAWPCPVLEGFEAAVTAPVEHAHRHGGPFTVLNPQYFPIQPGTFWALAALRAGPCDDPLAAFAAVSLTACLVGVVCGALWLRSLTGLSAWLCAGALLVCPELTVAAYYPNSSMLTLPFVTAGLLVMGDGERWWRVPAAAGVMAVGAWFRFDAVIYAALPVLALGRAQGRSRGALLRVAAFGAAFGVLVVALYAASGLSVLEVLAKREAHQSDTAMLVGRLKWAAKATFSLPVLALVAVGTVERLRRGAWWDIALIVGPIVAVPLAYGSGLYQSRYLLGVAPSIALGALFGVRAVLQWRPVPRYLAFAALALVWLGVGLTGELEPTNEGPRAALGAGAWRLPAEWAGYKADHGELQRAIFARVEELASGPAGRHVHLVTTEWYFWPTCQLAAARLGGEVIDYVQTGAPGRHRAVFRLPEGTVLSIHLMGDPPDEKAVLDYGRKAAGASGESYYALVADPGDDARWRAAAGSGWRFESSSRGGALLLTLTRAGAR